MSEEITNNDVKIEETGEHSQTVTPWDIEASSDTGVDYNKVVEEFGSKLIDTSLLERFERLTGHKPHPWLRRGYFFSHRFVLLKFIWKESFST